LLAALAVGATGDMSQEQWRVFNATGTTHLVAISGSHVTVFAALALGLAGFGWRLLARAGWRIPRDTTASAAALLAATGYSLLAGFSVPTQRTLIMLAAWLVARSAARACGPWRPLGVALIAVLVTDPYAALAAGFWLSFLAIAAILVVSSSRGGDGGATGAIVAFARVQLAVSATLAPATLAIFGGFALGGIVVNAVAIPAFTCVLVPLVLVGTASLAVAPRLAEPIFAVANGLYDAGWPALAAAADWPVAFVRAQPEDGWYALAAAALPIALLPWPGALRLTALAALAPLIPQPSSWSAPGVFEVVALDAGEALAVAVRTRDHLLVYDTGDSFRSGGRGAVDTVLPFLQANRLARVDALVLERLTADRVLGVARLMTRVPVERLVTGRDWPGGPASATRCQDAHWRWNAVDFALIVVPSTDESRTAQPSCLLRVTSRTGSALLTGDAWPVDLLRVARTRDLGADLVVVPRHGSRAERMGELAARLHPQLAVISSSFARLVSRHETVVAWRAAGARVQATATCGALRLVFAGRPLTPVCARDGWPWPWRRAGLGPGAWPARRPFPGAPAGTMAATLG
ncbi:MAG: ComEC/Rec2 family competence protein, partial [Steroidobacteraceae bacterium]